MFPLPKDLKLCASCVESERHRNRETDSEKSSKTKLERIRECMGETQSSSELEARGEKFHHPPNPGHVSGAEKP